MCQNVCMLHGSKTHILTAGLELHDFQGVVSTAVL